MPVYSNTPFQTPLLLQKGVPTYLFGSFSQQVANTQLALVTDAIDTDEATITAQLVSGRLPAVGDLISISGSANSSGDFNVSRVPVDSATFDAATNVMTVTFVLSASDQGETADGGTVIIEPAEVPETLAEWPRLHVRSKRRNATANLQFRYRSRFRLCRLRRQ